MALAIITFAIALVVIASERLDRTKVALAAMVFVLLTQTIGQEEAIAAIDWNTLGLLAGMMIMVKVTEPTGVYAWLAIRAGQRCSSRPASGSASPEASRGTRHEYAEIAARTPSDPDVNTIAIN